MGVENSGYIPSEVRIGEENTEQDKNKEKEKKELEKVLLDAQQTVDVLPISDEWKRNFKAMIDKYVQHSLDEKTVSDPFKHGYWRRALKSPEVLGIEAEYDKKRKEIGYKQGTQKDPFELEEFHRIQDVTSNEPFLGGTDELSTTYEIFDKIQEALKKVIY